MTSLGLPEWKPWYRYGSDSPRVLIARLRNRYRPTFRLRMAWQRARRGHSDDQLWNLNFACAELIVAGCEGMLYWGHGHPQEKTAEEWDDVLRRIAAGFQAWIDEDGWFHEKPEAEAKFNDAMSLYVEWFGGLWD